jgi:protocatechuate 3,4-dioxygenase beta subunit
MNDFVKRLEMEMRERGEKKFRVFLVYMNPKHEVVDATEAKIVQQKIKEWCYRQNLQKVAMVLIPSPVDSETSGLYEINPEAMNTVFLYKKREIAAKWVNMEYNEKSLAAILNEL